MLLGAVCKYYLGGKRDLVDVLKLRLMRWEVSLDYLGGLGGIKRVPKVFIYFGCAGSSLLHELFSSCGEQGNSLVAVAMQKLLIAVASFVAEHGFSGVVSDSCDPMDCSLSGSSVQGILQARIPEWVAMPSSFR